MQSHQHDCTETPCDGALLFLAMYLATVVWPTSMPSLSSSPWILGAPQSGLAKLMSRINFLMSAATFGRPPSDFDFYRQYRRKPLRCQRITDSGLTIAKALSTFGVMPYNPANISRSRLLNVGRFGDLRRRTFS
jgi:hypothetical protein